ncbi:MAG: DUF3473 domain-containing protein [Bacteroidia bacterium]|nr:DUF3473 domain-containing protein [Bacteroidia bacterium]MDW8301877.1 DUF3473 domain-containing protein [Bacteroidia bacterium]
MSDILKKVVFSVDLEDWFHGIELPFSSWNQYDRRIEKSFYTIFNLLESYQVKATWFTLGWIAEHYPHLIKELDKAGHELASHTYSHEKVYHLTREQFREEIKKTKSLIEDLTGKPILAHRSPFFSITSKSLWALDILAEEGFRIDCSISPVKTWRYGIATCPDTIFEIKENHIIEFPVSRFRLLKKNWGIGGAYFRLFPYFFTRTGIKKRQNAELPTIFYIHPWEYDPHHPKIPLDWRAKITHYTHLKKTYPRTERLIQEFNFVTLSQYISEYVKQYHIPTISIQDLQD